MAVFGIFKKLFGGSQQEPVPQKAPTVYDFNAAPVENLYCFEGTEERYFTWIFSYYFPHLEIERKTLPAGTSSCNYSDEPIVFTFSQDEKPVRVVILCHAQEYRRACIRHTVEHYESLGIPVQRYYTNFRNDSSYVVDRMKSAL